MILSDAQSVLYSEGKASLFRKAGNSSKAEVPSGSMSYGLTAKTAGNIKCYWRKSMKVGDLVRRRNNGDLAIVIETEWNPRCEKVDVLTMRGHKQYWYLVECEVISESR